MKMKIIILFVFFLLTTINTAAQTFSKLAPVYSKIAFSHQENQNDWEIWIINA